MEDIWFGIAFYDTNQRHKHAKQIRLCTYIVPTNLYKPKNIFLDY